VTVPLVGLDIGVYEYKLVVVDYAGHNVNSSVIVTVLEDTIPPTLNSPDDLAYAKGSTGNEIQWIASDNNPVYYIVFLDGTPIIINQWFGSPTITVNVDGLDTGIYVFELVVSDSVFNTTDSVSVYVYTMTTPYVTSPTTTPSTTITTTSTNSYETSITTTIDTSVTTPTSNPSSSSEQTHTSTISTPWWEGGGIWEGLSFVVTAGSFVVIVVFVILIYRGTRKGYAPVQI
jgi:hypothetical protein